MTEIIIGIIIWVLLSAFALKVLAGIGKLNQKYDELFYQYYKFKHTDKETKDSDL